MAYLTVYEKIFGRYREDGRRLSGEELGKDVKDEISFDDLSFEPDIEFDKSTGQMNVYGNLDTIDKKSMAFVSVDVKVDLDLAVEIIEYYMKKLGKLKTVLEATK